MTGKALRETVGILAVVASLVFVGAEIQQNNNLARGQARQALAEINQEWVIALTQDADYFDLWNRAWVVDGELTAAERSRASIMMIGQLRRLENVFFQYRESLVDDSALTAYGGLREAPHFQSPRFQRFWVNQRANYDPEFVVFFEQRLGLEVG